MRAIKRDESKRTEILSRICGRQGEGKESTRSGGYDRDGRNYNQSVERLDQEYTLGKPAGKKGW